MSEYLIKRLKEVMLYFNLTPNGFATKIKVDSSNWMKMLNGEQTVTDKTLQKIVKAFPQISYDWLRTGEGEMLLSVPPSKPDLPSKDSTLAELLTIIKNQQETIKTLSETVNRLTKGTDGKSGLIG